MKFNVEIECTPQEARAFLGLPDVQPMQEKLMQDMQARMSASLQVMDMQDMMRLWFAPNLKGFEQMLEAFTKMAAPKRE